MEATLVEALKELEASISAAFELRWTEHQKKLESLEERGTAPNDQKVIDLEKRLDDKDNEIAKLAEQLRLVLASAGALPGQNATHDGKCDFKGLFIPDVDAVRAAFRDSRNTTKAIDTALFVGGAGELPIEVADAFIDLIVEETTTLSRVTNRTMNGPTAGIDELRYAARQIIAATEGTAPSVADALTLVRRTLTSVETILAEDITLSFLEDNIEKQGVEAHIASIMARKYGTDLNDLFINGDTTTGTFLVINNGIIVLALADADVTDVALAGATTVAGALNLTLRGMPSRFLTIPDLAFILPTGTAQSYADEFSARQTSQGDDVLINGFPALRYFGRPVIPEPHMSEATAGITSDRKILFTSLSRMVNGIQRNFRIDSMWQPRKRVVEYTLTARTDAQYVSGEIISLGDGLIAALR
jgi:hypothetical protein